MSKWLFVLFTGKMACTLYDQKNTRFEDISSTIEWITIRFSLPLFIFPAPIFSYIQYYALHAGESSFFLAIPQMLVIFISLGVESCHQKINSVTKILFCHKKFTSVTKTLICHTQNHRCHKNSLLSQKKLSHFSHTKILFSHKKKITVASGY